MSSVSPGTGASVRTAVSWALSSRSEEERQGYGVIRGTTATRTGVSGQMGAQLRRLWGGEWKGTSGESRQLGRTERRLDGGELGRISGVARCQGSREDLRED